jgi:hypothetical protein
MNGIKQATSAIHSLSIALSQMICLLRDLLLEALQKDWALMDAALEGRQINSRC